MNPGIKQFYQTIEASEPFKRLKEELKSLQPGAPLTVSNVAGSLLPILAAYLFRKKEKQILFMAPDEDQAEKIRDDCAKLLGEASVKYLGARPVHPATALDLSAPIAQIETLKALISGGASLIVAHPRSVGEYLPLPESFIEKTFELSVGKEYNFQAVLEQLETLRFNKKHFVETYGDYSVRGGILDVFSYIGENPLRIEFWGNTVESIREFDVLSQRSIRKFETASIVPSLTQEEESDEEQAEPATLTATIFDYLASDALLLYSEPYLIEREMEELQKEGVTNLLSYEEIINRSQKHPAIISRTLGGVHSQISEFPSQATIEFQSVSQPAFNGSVNVLTDTINTLSRDGYTVYLSCDTKHEAERLGELIEDVLTKPEQIQEGNSGKADLRFSNQGSDLGQQDTDDALAERNVKPATMNYQLLSESFHSGFIYHPVKIALFTEHEIFGRLKRREMSKRKRFKGFSQKELQQLKPGDYVVHIDRGIGKFSGLQKIQVAGAEQEVMKILYQDSGALYVNLSSLHKVQKYSSQEGHEPKLSKLGSPEWERIRNNAKKRIKDIARDLIKLYAKRRLEQGFAFSSDSHWQRELEASFMYEDTPDQARATEEVKQDMERAIPMDRLVCGDVGFGKTEVAVRAAFKAVTDGKQVAVLVPTTILAMQHGNTFADRLSKYAVHVENLTRFKTHKEQNVVIKGMKEGKVDIVIGTHRLLSKDIAFKDLGLLIIDEEHRFGVTAKEKLRQLRASVDTLSLTATPIPRTLSFSLFGARDLSVIATPPRNRVPVITEIVPGGSDGKQTHWNVAREAIQHELHRGGQIYFVHDRVHDIDAVADQLKTRVPHARIHVAHGQMEGHELEQAMLSFLEKQYDVLVCTKIIESGLDIPSVNTIIINRADRFGMAELYQLRGRVGRSNVQGYAYLFTPPLSAVPKATLKRLQAIEEFTELGSGFNLAMRDLEIRGAGNLLGAEQSGFVAEMGFEMYEQTLREAVEELKDQEFKDVFKDQKPSSRISPISSPETIIDTDIDAYIPDLYVESPVERLDIYRRLSRTINAQEVNEIRDELYDRFGEFPEEVDHLLLIVMLRLAASKKQLRKIEIRGNTMIMTLPVSSNTEFYGDESKPDSPFQQIVKKMSRYPKGVMKFQQENNILKLIVQMQEGQASLTRLTLAKTTIEELFG